LTVEIVEQACNAPHPVEEIVPTRFGTRQLPFNSYPRTTRCMAHGRSSDTWR
jgi:hypothetical protein